MKTLLRPGILLLSLIWLSSAALAATAPPSIRSVAPPNWWQQTARHSLRLMVTGDHLADVQVSATPSSFRTSRLHASADGHYLFLTLGWTGRPAAGPVHLRFTNAAGAAHADFSFTRGVRPNPPGVGPDDVLYLIMVDRFARGSGALADGTGEIHRDRPHAYHGGDFAGIQQHLEYLKHLGIQAIWMTPIYDNGPQQDYHGYGSIDEYRVEEHFGTMASLRRLIAAAHRDGIKVVQDQVANHTGPSHPWVQDWPTPDWYNGVPGHPQTNDFNYAALVDPHASRAMVNRTLDGWFGGKLPDLNQHDAEVAQYEMQNAAWWLGTAGFDGIRQDTFPDVPCSFWRQWDASLRREFPQVTVVGEVFDAHPWVASYFENGCLGAQARNSGLTVFDYPMYFALRDVFIQGKTFREISDVLAQDRLYRDPGRLVTFLGNHDVSRFLTAANGSATKLKLAFTFLLTMRGEPLIYAGDEIGMTGGNDPDNRHDFPGGFPGDRQNAFTAAGRTAEQNDIWNHIHRLLVLRRQHVALRHGHLEELLTAKQQFAYLRWLDDDAVLVAFNTATQPVTVRFDQSEVQTRTWVDGSGQRQLQNGKALTLPPQSAVLLMAQSPRP